MDCPAVLELRGKRYTCQRPVLRLHHQRHTHRYRLSLQAQAEVIVTWVQVIGAQVRGASKCSTCGRYGHNQRTCVEEVGFATKVRAGA